MFRHSVSYNLPLPSSSKDLRHGAPETDVVQVTKHQAAPAPANASSSTLTPQAPGSGTLSLSSRPLSTYALLPTRASTSRVASAASAASFTAVRKSDGLAENASANAASGSTSVRDGGRAHVYVYNCSRAAETARDQSCSVATPTPEAESAWARAENRILWSSWVDTKRRSKGAQRRELTSTVRRWCRPFSRPPPRIRR
jgi:hypothetical protein